MLCGTGNKAAFRRRSFRCEHSHGGDYETTTTIGINLHIDAIAAFEPRKRPGVHFSADSRGMEIPVEEACVIMSHNDPLEEFGKPFRLYPNIKLFAAKERFKNALANTGLNGAGTPKGKTSVADILADQMSSDWEAAVFSILDSFCSPGRWVSWLILYEIDRLCKQKNCKVFIVPNEYHVEFLKPPKGDATPDDLQKHEYANQVRQM